MLRRKIHSRLASEAVSTEILSHIFSPFIRPSGYASVFSAPKRAVVDTVDAANRKKLLGNIKDLNVSDLVIINDIRGEQFIYKVEVIEYSRQIPTEQTVYCLMPTYTVVAEEVTGKFPYLSWQATNKTDVWFSYSILRTAIEARHSTFKDFYK